MGDSASDSDSTQHTHTTNNHITFPWPISAQTSIFGELFHGLNNNILVGQVCGLIDKIQPPLMNGSFNVNIYLVKARTLKVEQGDSQIMLHLKHQFAIHP